MNATINPKSLLLTIAVFLWIPLKGQHYTYRNYTINDGLTGNEVYRVMQDSKGYVWITTSSGVSRFNGHSFESFSMHQGLTSNEIIDVQEDREGRIWFVPYNGKLCYYSNNSIYPFHLPDSLQHLNIRKLIFHPESDKMGLGTVKNGIYQVVFRADTTIRHIYPKGFLFLVSRKEKYFLQTEMGVCMLDDRNDPVKIIEDFSKNMVLLQLPNGNILYAGKSSVFETDAQGKFLQKHDISDLTTSEVICLNLDQKGNLWLGTRGDGVFKFKNGQIKGEHSEQFLAGKNISSVITDQEGGLWFSALGSGVYYLPSTAFRSFTQKEGMPDQFVNCLAVVNNRILAGVDNGSLFMINYTDPETPVKEIIPPYARAFDIVQTQENEAWYCTRNSLYQIKNNTVIYTYDDEFIKGISTDNSGNIWGHSVNGIYNNKEGVFKLMSIFRKFPKQFTCIYIDHNDQKWIGTDKGVLNYSNGKLHPFLPGHAFLNNYRITDIFLDKNDILWLASHGGGIMVVVKDSVVYPVTLKNGLPSDITHCFFPDDNGIWVGTNNGICHISYMQGNQDDLNVSIIPETQGFVCNSVVDIKEIADTLILATDKGIIFVDKDKVGENKTPPPIYITGIQVNFNDTNAGGPLTLPYDQNNVSIAYTGVSFKSNGKLRYHYRLKGFDTTLRQTDKNKVTYASLAPGNYTFEVFAENTNNYRSRNPAILKITITPPFWKTWWFRIGVIVLIGTGIYGFFKVRILNYNRDVARELLNLLISKFRGRKKVYIKAVDGHYVHISPDDILWIQAAKNYVEFYTEAKKHLVHSTMKSVQKKLPADQFIRIHRSYLVNINKITKLSGTYLLIGEEKLPVGQTYRKRIREFREQSKSI